MSIPEIILYPMTFQHISKHNKTAAISGMLNQVKNLNQIFHYQLYLGNSDKLVSWKISFENHKATTYNSLVIFHSKEIIFLQHFFNFRKFYETENSAASSTST